MSSAEPSKQEIQAQLVEQYAQLYKNGLRTPILRRPSDVGLEYEDIWFPSEDGTLLQGWFIPAAGSKKLIIVNHPMTNNRSGYPGHLKEYGGFGGFEVSFIPLYKALHEAGFNIICYDLRNHGLSAQGSGGVCGALGHFESRDVIGSLLYARSRPDTKDMDIALLSQCMGGNSTIRAISRRPEMFKDIKCLAMPQPVSGGAFIEKGALNAGLDVAETCKAFDTRMFELTGYHTKDLAPQPFCKDVKLPTLISQVREDTLIDTKDTQEIFDLLGSKDKELLWIEGTTRRFDGYNYFSENPDKLLNFLKKYI